MSEQNGNKHTRVYGSPEVEPRDIPALSSKPASTPQSVWDPGSADLPLVPVDEPNRELQRQELSLAVDQALGRFALNGTLRIDDSTLVLETPRGNAAEEVHRELILWEHQSPQQRHRSANLIARRLAEGVPPSRAPRSNRVFRIDAPTLSLGVLAACVLGLAVYLGGWFPQSPSTVSQPRDLGTQPAATDPGDESRGNPITACEATRGRVHRGGHITMADAEGWVIEIGIIGKPNAGSLGSVPAMSEFFGPIIAEQAEYIWKDEPTLALTSRSQPKVQFVAEALNGTAGTRSTLTLTFSGSFVESYFDEMRRSKFVHLAHRVSEAVDADFAALYARCAHDHLATLGSWFMGPDGPGAATSLVYFMGVFARPRHIEAMHLSPPQTNQVELGFALDSIRARTIHLDRSALSTLVGSEGGMAVGAADRPVVVTFPFRDGNRASRASRTIARVTGMRP